MTEQQLHNKFQCISRSLYMYFMSSVQLHIPCNNCTNKGEQLVSLSEILGHTTCKADVLICLTFKYDT